jgi:hypothetical protein
VERDSGGIILSGRWGGLYFDGGHPIKQTKENEFRAIILGTIASRLSSQSFFSESERDSY